MNDSENRLQGILDISPPSAPWQYTWEANAFDIIVSSLVLLCLVSLIAFFLWRHFLSRKARARLKIRALSKQYTLQHITEKQVAFQLASILKDTLNLTQLSQQTVLPSKLLTHEKRWLEFNSNLSVLRYADKTEAKRKHAEDLPRLINDADFWLRHWPNND